MGKPQPEVSMNPIDFPHFIQPDPSRYTRAEWFQERIEKQIEDFTAELKDNEVLLASVVLPSGEEIAATWFGYYNPNMLIIDGIDRNGRRVRVLVSHTEAHILLRAVLKVSEKANPIGFQKREDE